MSRCFYTSSLAESQGSRGGRARFADLPGILRALLHQVARGSIIYVPHNGGLSPDDHLLAQYLYLRWVAGLKHTVAVAEVAADSGLSVDTVVRRLREIRRRRGEQSLRRARAAHSASRTR